MLANGTEFAWHTSAGPEKLYAMMGSALWTYAFRLFLAQTNRLNAFDLLFGVAVSLSCFHGRSPTLRVGFKGS